ncbi:variable surface lipoprotein [Mycoplasmopsis californica]|uniref:variable surface lipoprotein n=1 Tax=Mycoplasmopsis californica TaxID=2113 RepID=UPI000F62B9AA|nr:variable surface lipoprotein [Mycoplasmopsis californica]
MSKSFKLTIILGSLTSVTSMSFVAASCVKGDITKIKPIENKFIQEKIEKKGDPEIHKLDEFQKDEPELNEDKPIASFPKEEVEKENNKKELLKSKENYHQTYDKFKKLSQEITKNTEFSELDKKLADKLQEIEKLIANSKTKADYDSINKILEEFIERIEKEKTEIIKSKSSYEESNKKQEILAQELQNKPEYNSILTELKSAIEKANQDLNSSKTKESYNQAKQAIEQAIEKANAQKAEHEEAKSGYEESNKKQEILAQELQNKPEYNSILTELKSAIEKANQDLNSSKTKESYNQAKQAIEQAIEKANAQKAEHEEAKSGYEESNKKQEILAQELQNKPEYNSILTELKSAIEKANQDLNSSKTKESYNQAKQAIEQAIEKANAQKAEHEEAKSGYEESNKKQEILAQELQNKPEYNSILAELKSAIEKANQDLNSSKTKESYNQAKQAIEQAIEKANAQKAEHEEAKKAYVRFKDEALKLSESIKSVTEFSDIKNSLELEIQKIESNISSSYNYTLGKSNLESAINIANLSLKNKWSEIASKLKIDKLDIWNNSFLVFNINVGNKDILLWLKNKQEKGGISFKDEKSTKEFLRIPFNLPRSLNKEIIFNEKDNIIEIWFYIKNDDKERHTINSVEFFDENGTYKVDTEGKELSFIPEEWSKTKTPIYWKQL